LALQALLEWMKRGFFGDALLAGFFLFCCAGVKNEGLLLCAALMTSVVASLLLRKGIRPACTTVGLLLAGFLPPFCLWLRHLTAIPAVSDENYLPRLMSGTAIHGLSRLDAIAREILSKALEAGQWHLLWVTLPALAVLIGKRGVGRKEEFLPLLLLLYWAGMVAVYVLSPWRDIGLHIDVTFDRVMLPMLPVVLMLWHGASRKESGRGRTGDDGLSVRPASAEVPGGA